MCFRVITSGVRLLIAAVFFLLLAFPAAAHPGHDHGASPLIAVAALDALLDQASSGELGTGEQVIAAPTQAPITSCCCCRHDGCCTGVGCGTGMAAGSGSCDYSGSAIVGSHAVRVAFSAKGAVARLSDQLLAGDAPSPNDRPPRV